MLHALVFALATQKNKKLILHSMSVHKNYSTINQIFMFSQDSFLFHFTIWHTHTDRQRELQHKNKK